MRYDKEEYKKPIETNGEELRKVYRDTLLKLIDYKNHDELSIGRLMGQMIDFYDNEEMYTFAINVLREINQVYEEMEIQKDKFTF